MYRQVMSEKPKEKSGDERAQDLIRKIRHQAGYRGKDVEPLSTRKKKADEAIDLLALGKGAVTAYKAGRTAYDAYKHPLTQDLIAAVKKKFRKKKKKVEETTKSKGEIRQGIANKHFNLILKGKKDSEAAKRLKDAYRQREETTVPRKKWNPIKTGGGIIDKKGKVIPLGTDARLEPRRANRGYVNPKGGDMTTTDPRTGLPMMVVKRITREDANKNER